MRRLAVLAVFALPVVPAQAQDADDDGEGFLTELIESQLSDVTRSVDIVGFAGALSSSATIERLSIADAEGVWLEAEGLALVWDRRALFSGRLEIETLSAERIVLPRAPVADPDLDLPPPEATPFALPDLPVSISIGALSADRIEIGAPLIGEELLARLTATATLEGGAGAAEITLERIDATKGRFEIAAGYSNESRVLDLDLVLAEAAGGLVTRTLRLPGAPDVRFALQGQGPLDGFAGQLAIATAGTDRVTGSFGSSPAGEATRYSLDIRGDVTALVNPEFRPFFGDDLRLQAFGRAEPDGSVTLQALDIAAEQVRLVGSAAFGPDGWPSRLQLEGGITGAEGAPVRLPAAGAETLIDGAELSVRYNGAVDDGWTGRFRFDGLVREGLSLPLLTLDGSGTLEPGDGAAVGRLTADLDYRAEGLAFLDDPRLAAAVPADIFGRLRLIREEDAPLALPEFTLAGDGLSLQATATLDGAEVEATVLARAEDFARFAPLAGIALGGAGEVQVTGTARPLDGAFDAVLTAQTEDLRIGDARVDPLLEGSGRVAMAAVRDTAGLRLNGLTVTTPAARLTGEARIASDGSAGRIGGEILDLGRIAPGVSGAATLAVEGGLGADGAARGTVDLVLPTGRLAGDGTRDANGVIAGRIDADLDRIDAYAALFKLDLAGGAAVAGSGRFDPSSGAAEIDAEAETRDLVTGVARIDPLLAGQGTLQIVAAGQIDDTPGPEDLDRADVALDLPALVLEADLTGSGGTIAGTVSGEVKRLDLIGAAAGQDLSGRVDMTWEGSFAPTTGAYAGVLSANTLDLSVGREGIDPLLAGRGTLRVDAAGRIDDTPGPEDLARLDFAVDLPAAALTADLTGGETVAGRLSGDLRRLDLIGAAAGQDLTGRAELDWEGSFAPGTGAYAGVLSAITSDLTVGRDRIDPLLAGRGTIRLDAAGRIDETPGPEDLDRADLAIDLPAARVGATVARDGADLAGSAEADLRQLSTLGAAVGQRLSGSATLGLDGRFTPASGAFAASLTGTTANLGIGQALVDRLTAGSGRIGGRVTGTGSGGFGLVGGSVVFPNVEIRADAQTDGSAGTATYDARLRDIGLFTDALSGPVTANGRAAQEGGAWRIDTDLGGPGGAALRAAGVVAPRPDLAITGNLPLALLNRVLEPRRLAGDAQVSLRAEGGFGLSALSGTVSLGGARLAAPTLGEALENMTGQIALGGGQARVDLSGALPAGGTVTVDGPVGLSSPFDAGLTIALDRLKLRDPRLYETRVSGGLSIRGPLAGGARIGGQIELGRTEIRVPSSTVGALGALPDVTHVGAGPGVRETLDRAGAETTPNAAPTGTRRPYPLDITVSAPSRIFVRGRGLEAELGGSLRLTGTTGGIVPAGQFGLIRGRLDILQQRFDLSEGSGRLQGDFLPRIRLVARTEADSGTVVEIIVEGPANAPEVRFTSQPELPQDEVLSQLLFGRSVDQITPLQAVQLASAAATLAGRGDGGVIGRFREGLDLDTLDFATDDTGNAAVRAGKYISENIYTEVTVDSEGETAIDLNIDLTDSLTARGSVGADGETSLGIFFERDY